MSYLLPQFAATTEPEGGISALGLNLKGFLFQLLTFVLVLLVLRRWVFPKLVATLEKRRETLEQSLVQARQTQEALQSAETKAAAILRAARQQADAALADARAQAEELIAAGEKAAEERAKRVAEQAEAKMEQDRQRLREELRVELAEIVAVATEKVIARKLNEKDDRALIERSLKGIMR